MNDANLRVLQMLTHQRIQSGGAIQAFLLARGLVRRGHRVTMAVYERHGKTDAATREKIESIGCTYAGLRLRGLRTAVSDIRAVLRKGNFDVVHLHREGALTRFLQAAPVSPSVAAVANVGTSKPPSPRHAARLRARKIDRVVVVAEAIKRLLIRTADVEPSRVEVVYGAYDEERFHPDILPYDRRAQFNVDPNCRLIGLIANFDKKKGHDHFIRAAAEVHRERGDCYFVCAGKGTVEEFHTLADAHALPRERLLPIGFHDDIPRLLKSLDLSVSASTHGEGLTGAVRESLAMGTPVVTTAVAGNVEVVRHEETGLLVPPADPPALAKAILRALAEPDATASRAERGMLEVRDRLTTTRRAELMEWTYREVIEWRRVKAMPIKDILYPEWRDPSTQS